MYQNEFYVIQEEFFDEDANRSSYEPLKKLLFKSEEEAVNHLKNYFEENKFQSMERESREDIDEDQCFIIADKSFNRKYGGEGRTKLFYIQKLTLFK